MTAVPSSRTYLITGANRGIGLYLTKKLLSNGEKVIATCRNPAAADELRKLEGQNNLSIEELDVTSDQSAKALAERLKSKGTKINVLINNAGILKNYDGSIEKVPSSEILEIFETNTLGPHRVTQVLLPLIEAAGDKPPVILSVSSTYGSIGDNTSGKCYGYRMSKAALNMWNRSLSQDLKGLCIVLCPGWVQTDMGGANAMLTPTESTNNIADFIGKLTLEHTGKFFNHSGKEIPW
eukprot:TRINITY_DN3095_c0_g1_i3.p1 TRINITY_DN3095_c0_g1~~TRINITY_DN3095_c0_g1_i3.p1  ORF type:complete len:249 (-),score=73.06 TRINITY_DN3095_c0_g1_i3:94-804(-)